VVRATQTEIEAAVEALRNGEVVVFPTETVYGLGANASNPAAVRKIFEMKGRPADHPVIVHLDNPRYLHRWVSEVPPVAEKLAAKFWPGPLTLILPRGENVNDVVTGGQDSIGIRVPSHPIAQQLLTAFGGGIAPRSPGDRMLHYAPSTPLEIVSSDDLEVRAGEIVAREEKVAVLAMRPPLNTQRYMTWINAGKKPEAYAHNLYNHLRTLDRAGCTRILVQELPLDERWAAILDRLQRASGVGLGVDDLELSAG